MTTRTDVLDPESVEREINLRAITTQDKLQSALDDSLRQMEMFSEDLEQRLRNITEEFKQEVGRIASTAILQLESGESGPVVVASDEEEPHVREIHVRDHTRVYDQSDDDDEKDKRDESFITPPPPVATHHVREQEMTREKKSKGGKAALIGGIAASLLLGIGIGYWLDDDDDKVTVSPVPAWAADDEDAYESLSDTFEPPVVYNIIENDRELYEEMREYGVPSNTIANIMNNRELFDDFIEAGVDRDLTYRLFEDTDRLNGLVDQGFTASQIEDIYLAPDAYELLIDEADLDPDTAIRVLAYPQLVERLNAEGLDDPVIAEIIDSPELFYALTELELTLDEIIDILTRYDETEWVEELAEEKVDEPDTIIVPAPEVTVETPEPVVIIQQPVTQPTTTPETPETPETQTTSHEVYVEHGHGFVHEIRDTFPGLDNQQAYAVYDQVIEQRFGGNVFINHQNGTIGSYWYEPSGEYRISEPGYTEWHPEVMAAMIEMIERHGWQKN